MVGIDLVINFFYLSNIGDVLSLLDLTLLVHDFSPLLQISVVKKEKYESRERAGAASGVCIIAGFLGSFWDRFLPSALP